MSDSLIHRGPDDFGLSIDGPVGFAFRRLSILDLTPSGHQPMTSVDGKYTIVFNGEIYNYIELRNTLRAMGHVFSSSGDTEVLLHAYMQWGPDCLSRLNGMWSFLIHDKQRRTIFGARDRFGIKPLFFHKARDFVLFASEIKGIRASDLYDDCPNWAQIARFLFYGRLDDTQDTCFSSIHSLPAGSAFELDYSGQFRLWSYWSITESLSQHDGDAPTAFRQLFDSAVSIRLRTDVPLGVFLSGGLDSTSILCTIAQHATKTSDLRQGQLSAFSFNSPEHDEQTYVDDTVHLTRANLHSLGATPIDLWDSLPQVLWYHDEPIHSATALVGFALARMTSKHGITVILNGQGADEVLAGYPSYFHDYWLSLLSRGHILRLQSEIRRHHSAHGEKRFSTYHKLADHLLRSTLHRFRPYRMLSAVRRQRQLRALSWYSEDFKRYTGLTPSDPHRPTLRDVLKYSIETDPLPLYLRIEDRNSMAHSLEARLPFLDYRLVSFAWRLSDEWKLNGPWNKYILRRAMKDLIPESVATRVDKMGFPTPLADWVRGPWYEPINDILHSSAMKERGIYDVRKLQQSLQLHRRGITNTAAALFDAVQIELWSRMATREFNTESALPHRASQQMA